MQFLMGLEIGWLPSLAGLFCWLLIVICALRILLPHVWSNLKLLYPTFAPKLLRFAAGLGFLGLSFFAGYHAGYDASTQEQNSHTVVWDNKTGAPLVVLHRSAVDPAMYRFRPAKGEPFSLKFCTDRIPNFDVGVVLNPLKYEDRGVCQSIAGKHFGYRVVRDEQEQPIIANERYTNAQ